MFNYSCPYFPSITLPCPAQPHLPHSILPAPHHCLCPWVPYTCSLTTFPLLPLVIPLPIPSGYCQVVLYFHISASILLTCLQLGINLFSNFQNGIFCQLKITQGNSLLIFKTSGNVGKYVQAVHPLQPFLKPTV